MWHAPVVITECITFTIVLNSSILIFQKIKRFSIKQYGFHPQVTKSEALATFSRPLQEKICKPSAPQESTTQ